MDDRRWGEDGRRRGEDDGLGGDGEPPKVVKAKLRRVVSGLGGAPTGWDGGRRRVILRGDEEGAGAGSGTAGGETTRTMVRVLEDWTWRCNFFPKGSGAVMDPRLAETLRVAEDMMEKRVMSYLTHF